MAEAPKPNPSYAQAERKAKADKIVEKVEAEQEKRERHVEKAVKGNVKLKKKPVAKRMGEAIIGEDIQEVKSYLIWDVLLPAVKDTIAELVKKGIDAVLYGGASAPSNVKRRRDRSRPSYSDYYDDRRRDDRRRPRKPNRRAMHSFDDILFEDRFDAENVLSCLVDITQDYGMCSVADFYELAGEEPQWSDNKYGWGDVGDAQVVRTRDGYILDLPRPEPID